MAVSYDLPLDIPKTYYLAIGQVIARTALLEHQVMILIGKLLDLKNPKQVRVSFMGMTMKARLAALKALATEWAPTTKLKQEICAIVTDVRKIVDIRNSFAHGQWGYKATNKAPHVIFAKEGKDFYLPQSRPYKSKEIVAKAQEVRTLNKRIMRVIEALDASRAP